MGIIGVVAALTLPNLNSSTGDKEKVAKVKKIYSNLNDAFGRAEAVYGPFGEWSASSADAQSATKKTAERITEFMKISKDCANNVTAGCFNTGEFKNLTKTPYVSKIVGTDSYAYILADGTSICFSCSSTSSYCGIFFDIDGANKGSFTMGKDLFYVGLDDNEGIFTPHPSGHVLQDCLGGSSSMYGGCVAWILQNDNMDYLKVDSSGKCPDGNTVLDDGTTNTTCK